MDFLGKVTCDHIVGDPSAAYTLDTCPRCLGEGTYGGLSFSDAGNLNLVEKADYLVQEITKILIEKARETGYGFNYDILKHVIDSDTIGEVQREVNRCMKYLIDLQQSQKSLGTIYAPSEEISSIDNIKAKQSTNDPREIYVYVDVTALSGIKIQVTKSLLR